MNIVAPKLWCERVWPSDIGTRYLIFSDFLLVADECSSPSISKVKRPLGSHSHAGSLIEQSVTLAVSGPSGRKGTSNDLGEERGSLFEMLDEMTRDSNS